jgi:NADH-quinone oxidoreductase subunit C
MLGVYFENHPDNRRLLLPEDWADLPPMRKDFKIKGR